MTVAASGPGAASVRLGDAPLRPPPDPGGDRAPFRALAWLLGERGGGEERFLIGVGAGDDRLALAADAVVVVRVAPAQARGADEATVLRQGADVLVVAFAGGGRLTLTAPPGAAVTLAFADGARLALAPSEAGAAAGGFDLRL